MNFRHVPHVLKIRCHWCSKQREDFRVHRLASNQVICDYCLEWHMKALDMLAGTLPPGCQGCDRTMAQLYDSSNGVEVRMYVVPKDGIYQVLCRSCIQPYTGKRSDLYTGTKFGKETLKL